VSEHDGQRHQLLALGTGIAEHQPLVPGAEPIHPHRDIARLLVDGGDDAARLEVEAELGAGVADALDGVPGDARDIHVAARGDLAGHHDEPGGEQRLARHPTHRVLGQDRVQHRVRDLVRDLVGMPLRHRFGSEPILLTRHQLPPLE
jgi:hypothetical protein